MQKKRGLGRGLSDLGLGELLQSNGVAGVVDAPEVGVSEEPLSSPAPGSSLCQLNVEQVVAGRYQPRTQFAPGALEELAQSIRSQGVIQPIVVRKTESGYELIAGERRWRAAQLAGLKVIPAIVRELSDDAAVAMSLIENIQREDLNAIEEAVALNRLLHEFSLTHQEVSEVVGKSRAAVSNLVRLLRLQSAVKAMVENGQLEMGHARALLSLEGAQQVDVAKGIIARQLSVRQAEAWVKSLLESSSAETAMPAEIDPNIKKLQYDLSDKLCARVVIRHQPKGKGQLVVHYNSVDELDGILDRIQ
ncbi:MAG: chromosome partitioning protein ParB [Legionellales bacterium]|nr:chromosome partitioning protein ParB [Legionellales bacterium]